jgi:hypothetical protein
VGKKKNETTFKMKFSLPDDATRTAIAQVLLTLGQNYSDGIKDHIRGLIVPLAFLGMHTGHSQGKYFINIQVGRG